MQNLHAQIEGSAKFVRRTPGRHVTEIDGILALNAATYKPMSTVRFVLLDDDVLVDHKRRRRNASENDKLVADCCWPLNERNACLDMKDTTSAYFRHTSHIQAVVYCHTPHWRLLMSSKSTTVRRPTCIVQIRLHTRRIYLCSSATFVEEPLAKKHKEHKGKHKRWKSLWDGDG